MKKMLKLFMILNILILLSGCGNKNDNINTPSIKYSMDFNNEINEKIEIYMPSNAKEKAKLPSADQTIEPPLEYTYLYNDLKPLINNSNYIYKKSDIVETENYTYLDLTANLNYDNIKNSSTLNNCFEKVNIEEKEDYLNILLGGYFMCGYGDTTTLEFKGKNILSTSLPSTGNNTYSTKIGDKLTDYIKLSISTKPKLSAEKESSFVKTYTMIGIFLMLAIAIFLLIFKKINSANSF